MSQIKWDKLYKSIEERDLGIRNLRTFNIALLDKWNKKVDLKKRGILYEAPLNRYELSNEAWIRMLMIF